MLGKKTKKFFSLFLSALTAASMMPLSSVTTMAAQNDTCDTCGNSTDSNGFCTVDDCGGYEKPKTTFEHNKTFYTIENAGQLFWFANYVNNGDNDYFYDSNRPTNMKLVNDIDLNPGYTFNADGTVTNNGKTVTEGFRKWIPIGNIDTPYSGMVNHYEFKEAYTIRGLYIADDYRYDNQGFIGYANEANIYNINIENSYIDGYDNVGGICGYDENSNINKCNFSGTINGNNNIGGICGFGKSIDECTFTGTVNGCYNVGGISGNNNNWLIYGCSVAGTINGDSCVGGICGTNGSVNSCNVSGFVNGNYTVGGLCGANSGSEIHYSYNTATVTGKSIVGGLCGDITSITQITNSFNIGKIQGGSSVGGICGTSTGVLINNCYNYGEVFGNGYDVGAISGYFDDYGIDFTSFGYSKKSSDNCYYLLGCVKNGSNTVQLGFGNFESDSIGVTSAKTKTQFSSGEVAYLLNGENAGTENAIWKQNVGTDDYPTFDGNTVYFDATGYKLRGTITLKLEETKLAGVYRGVVDLPAGTYKFVVDDLVNNKSYGRASTYTDNIANCGFGNNWGYCTLETTGGRYTFTFNSKNNYLSVTCDNSYAESFSTYKLRGSVNAVLTKTDNENIIKNTVVLPAGSYKFVVTDDATGISYGRHASYEATIENALCGNNWGYINFTAQATGTYEFTYNTKTNRITVVKK